MNDFCELVPVTGPPTGAPCSHRTAVGPELDIDRSVQAQLGRRLQHLFETVGDEQVPDRFAHLLARLDTTED